MSVIIRLQNLPWSANALDIRQYFSGLSIPEGGVHIVGGELGDAFIAFSTDEDARQAFQRNNGKIKSVQITLTLSSRTEMQRVIEAARSQTYAAFMQAAPQIPMPAAVPPVHPAPVPETISRDSSPNDNKRDRRRSRSRSRDRRDRSRDRRRARDRSSRSRSRSRDRRRRRDRSRSADRSRSRDRRTSRDSSRRRSNDSLNNSSSGAKEVVIEPWAKAETSNNIVSPNLLSIANIVELRRNLAMNSMNPALNGNGFQNPLITQAARDNNIWPPRNMNDLNEIPNDSGNNDNFNNQNQMGYITLPNCCVKIEPFYGSYGDIRHFFSGSFISNKGIKFVNDVSGTRTGIVYVQFGNQLGKIEALSRNNENFNGVNLSISHIDDRQFENAIDCFLPRFNEDDNNSQPNFFPRASRFEPLNPALNPNELMNFTCLTVEDLPNYAKEQDILKMFSLYPLNGIVLPSRGRDGQIAYAKFCNNEDAKKALAKKHLHIFDGKSVTVKPCRDEDFDRVSKENEENVNAQQPDRKFETKCLYISGLPMKTNDRDIADFFSDVGVNPAKIHLINNEFGRFSGQAFCEFESADETEKAADKDSCILGTHLITVKPVQRDEMERIINGRNENHIRNERNHDVENEMDANSLNNFQMGQGGGPRPLFEQRIPPFDHSCMNMNNINNHMMRGRGGFMGRPRISRFSPLVKQPPPGMQLAPPDDMIPPGCTVYMNNIPYKAGTNEILDFFDGYNATNQVSRKFNANNTPTAEAKVVFHTPEDAYIAVRDKHMRTIWDRPIYLRQV